VLSIGPLARKPFRAGPEVYAPKHGRLRGGFFNHRNRPEACPGQAGSSQQGLKNPGGKVEAVSPLGCHVLNHVHMHPCAGKCACPMRIVPLTVRRQSHDRPFHVIGVAHACLVCRLTCTAVTHPPPHTRTPSQVRQLLPSARGLSCTWHSVVKISQSLYEEAPGMDPYRPDQATPVPNFFLSGSYTKQDYIDSMEGATLSGERHGWSMAGGAGIHARVCGRLAAMASVSAPSSGRMCLAVSQSSADCPPTQQVLGWVRCFGIIVLAWLSIECSHVDYLHLSTCALIMAYRSDS
jgi:hypothetical protein